MKKIIWINSYPKSGNTWVRSLISSLLYSKDGEFNFNLLKLIEVFEKYSRYNFVKDINKSDFNNLNKINIISKYWLECQKNIVFDENISPVYKIFKTHSANLSLNKCHFTNSDFTAANIHIVRDPRELVISFSKHFGKTIDDTIESISDFGRLLSPRDGLTVSLMSSWSIHYESWQKLNVPTLLIKYEDLLKNIEIEIEKILYFLGQILDIDEKKISKKFSKIISSTNITKVRDLEKNFGFDEASNYSKFFGEAKINSWQKILTKNQINKIEGLFEKSMIKLKYI